MSAGQDSGWQAEDEERGREIIAQINAMTDEGRRSLLIFLSGWLGSGEWDRAVAGFDTLPGGVK